MKRLLIIAILLLPAVFACKNNEEDGIEGAVSVFLDKDKIDLVVGQTATLSARVLPESLNMGVVWSVLDSTYAVVNDGKVSARAEGVTYVVATSEDGLKRAACMVSVNPLSKNGVIIQDDNGQNLNGVYGYPGMSVSLSAHIEGDESHTFTWTLEDSSVGTITSDGVLTLAAVESSDPAYLYDVQSYLKVTADDGSGSRIPVRSSLLKGIRIGSHYQPYGLAYTVEASQNYNVAVLCQGEFESISIPTDAVVLEASNTEDFTMKKVGGSYTMVTGPETGVSTKIYATLAGSSSKNEIAELTIVKVYPIKAQLVGRSSSTLVYTWTEGIDAEDDISKPYTISLYNDAACTDLFLTYSIEAYSSCWNDNQPRFVFTGLNPDTEYWLKVVDTSKSDMESDVISGTTEAFTIVQPSDTPASAGDIILAEDFSELCWMADEVNQAAGYDVGSNDKSTFQDRTVNEYVGFTGKYCSPERIITAQSAKKASGLRLGKWAGGYTARLYVGPGYVFLGTTKYVTHLVSPALSNIPEGKTAKLEVTVHAAGYKKDYEALIAVQDAATSFYTISSNNQTNKNKLDLTTNAKTFTYTGGLTTLGEFTVTLEGVKTGDRLAFGPTKEDNEVSNNQHMMLISDMTVKIIELK